MNKIFSKCTIAIATAALNLAIVLPSVAAVLPSTTYAGKTLYDPKSGYHRLIIKWGN